ncbi:MAG: hypothetical protein JO010_12100 [Alphaproteobacteria bacterium]|nr:hypothetical protein [Alphaproteobacteria bacterium]
MTSEEFEAEVERLDFVRKDEQFVARFLHVPTGTCVDYVPARGNCLFIDFERTLAALREVSAARPKRVAPSPSGGDLLSAHGITVRKAPAHTVLRLPRLQEEALSSLLGGRVALSDQAVKGEALEVEGLARRDDARWLVFHPDDAHAMLRAATIPQTVRKKRI